MNRLSGQWAAHQATTLNSTPTIPILSQIIKLAETHAGQAFTVNWLEHDSPFYLEVVVVEQPHSPLARSGRNQPGGTQQSMMQWVHGGFLVGDYGKQEKKQLWTQFTRDPNLIMDLLADSRTAKASSEAAVAPNQAFTGINQPRRTGRFNALNKFTKTALPSVAAAQKGSDVTLSGELNKVELTGILQSISICKMTGRLDLQDTFDGIEVFFEDGAPVHACQMRVLNTAEEIKVIGDSALLSALIWDTGSFSFLPERRTSERTIRRKLEILLLEGACLKDYNSYLQAANINGDSMIHQRMGALSEELFAEKIAAGMPMDSRIQKSVYDLFDGQTRLSDIIHKLGLLKPVWIPVLFSLLSCNLISLDDLDSPHQKTVENERIIDPSLVAKAERDLARYETGFLSFPLFMLFLQREVDRYIDSGTPFALAVFEIWHGNEGMSNEKLQKVAGCFRSLAASYDLIGHYHDFEFALILPLKGESDTREFVEIFQKFVADSFDDENDSNSIRMMFGIATADSIAFEAFETYTLVQAALKAKQTSKQQGISCISIRQLEWEDLRKQADSLAPGDVTALVIWQKLYDEALHLQFDFSYWSDAAERYSTLLLQAGKYADAEQILSELIHFKTELLGAEDISTVTTAGELAHCYYAQGKYNDAEWMTQGVLKTYAKVYGEDSLLVATCHFNLATLYHVQHNYAAAEPNYRKAMEIRKLVLGADHPDTKKSQNTYDSLVRVMTPALEKQAQLITGGWAAYQPEENESIS